MEEREPVIKILYENTTRPVNRVLLTFPLSGREKPEQKMLPLTRGHEKKSSMLSSRAGTKQVNRGILALTSLTQPMQGG